MVKSSRFRGQRFGGIAFAGARARKGFRRRYGMDGETVRIQCDFRGPGLGGLGAGQPLDPVAGSKAECDLSGAMGSTACVNA